MLIGSKSLGHICAFLCAVIFSCHYLVAKEVIQTVDPLVLGAFRGLIGGGILAMAFPRKLLLGINLKSAASLATIAIFTFVINQTLFLKGLNLTDSVDAALISNTIPVVSLLLAILFKLESLSLKKFSLAMIPLMVIAFYFYYLARFNLIDTLLGNLLIFLNVVSLCIGFSLLKKILGDMDQVTVTIWTLSCGGLCLLSLTSDAWTQMSHYTLSSGKALLFMLFEVIISTSLAYYLNYKSLALIPISSTTSYVYFQVPFTAALSYFVGGDMINPWIGAVFVVILVCNYLQSGADNPKS
ncbi:MAG: DMT family transporter [Pseudobacteriovorax sp.]|nr:DMT family transporter [Pseudobacteriovorax sp.]